jgi:DNA-binding transcriptional ArsR family regulator
MPRWALDSNRMLIKDIMMRLKFIMSEPRWTIIKILKDSVKGTNEIYEELKAKGYALPRSTVYYHLSSLEEAGIIEMAGYREVGGGAPEKTWRLKVTKLCINITTGELISE